MDFGDNEDIQKLLESARKETYKRRKTKNKLGQAMNDKVDDKRNQLE